MDQVQWHFLLSEAGQRILAETAETPITEENHLRAASRLRQQIDPHLAQAVIETVWLRQRAVDKFSRADQMYFTREALEQSSSEIISAYRARRFFSTGFKRIADLGCGIGGDALALASQADVTGIEQDWLRLAMAQENVQEYGNRDRFFPLRSDLTKQQPVPVEAYFFDPARRDDQGKRLKSVHLYRPPLNLIDAWRQHTAHAAVKVSPGIDYAEIPPDAQVEFISVSGSVKECVLWYGDLRCGDGRQATLLPGEDVLTSEDNPGAVVPPREPGAYLYEPDGAVIRAHLIQTLARRLGAAPIDPSIAYLTADDGQQTPFARCFAIEDWFPFHLKRLRQYLREHHIGRVTIKKRGSPLEPEALQSRLRLKGDEERILFLTHVLGEPVVLVGKDADLRN
ncbi:MAG: class I SAM-dependent methyltransferase [Candidatus Promineifilaceae bacterium]|jgi:SAM-dependent methyltransferase